MISRIQAANQLAIFVRKQSLIDDRVCNIISKRWSGHNNMKIVPSSWTINHYKNLFHLYFMLGAIPLAIFTTIINIRANPELIEIPEGYEPLPWEYHKRPTQRWMAKYLYRPNELDHEVYLATLEEESETLLMRKISSRVQKVMTFYNDHRSKFFRPHPWASYVRSGRDESAYGGGLASTIPNYPIDDAYDPSINPVPTEGYKPID